MKRKTWIKIFLTFTAIPILMEVYAAFDKNPITEPWTYLIVGNIPAWITYLFFSGLFVWLMFHFKKFYKLEKLKSLKRG